MLNKYYNAVTNRSGDALPGYYVRLFDSTGAQVTLYADDSLTPIISVSGKADAAVANDNGMVSFWHESGIYDIRYYDTNDEYRDQEPRVPLIRGVSDAELAASGGAALVGSTSGNVQSDLDDLSETAASLLSLVPNFVTSATAFDATDLNQTFIISGSSSFLLNLPPAANAGDTIKLYAARGYTGLCSVQAASGSGLTVDGLSIAYLIAGEGGIFVYDGSGWIIVDRQRVPIIAEMRNSGSTSLTTGSFGQVQFPTAGTQMMQADLKALWGYSGGYFTAPRPGPYRLTVSVWLNHSGSGQYDVGAYSGSTTGGTPSDTQFARVSVDSSTYRTIQYAGEFAMVAGEKLFVSVRPLTVTSAKVEDSAILVSRIVIEELIR